MKKLSTLDIIDSIQFIEDGINAAHAVALSSENILTDEQRDDAFEWVMAKLKDSTQDLRAELTAQLAREKKDIRAVNE